MLPTPHATGIIGVAVMPQTAFSGDSTFNFISIKDAAGGVTHLVLTLNASNQIVCRRGASGTVLATGTTVLTTGVFYFVEFKFTISDTVGTIEVRLNGSTSSELAATGIDTRNGGNATWDTLALGPGYNATFRFDDLYVLDGGGSAPHNDFLGDCRVEALLPQTGNGTNTGLTCSTGSDHGALVDENPPNDDTDYNSSSTVNAKDTYNYPSLSATPLVVYGIQPTMRARKTDAGAQSIAHVVRSGGADTDGANVNPTTSYLYSPEIWTTDPATGIAWTAAGIAAMEVGMKVTA